MGLYIRIVLESIVHYYNFLIMFTVIYSDRSPVPVRSTVKSYSTVGYLTSWNIQKLSTYINQQSTSTTAFGKLFQILTILLVN